MSVVVFFYQIKSGKLIKATVEDFNLESCLVLYKCLNLHLDVGFGFKACVTLYKQNEKPAWFSHVFLGLLIIVLKSDMKQS